MTTKPFLGVCMMVLLSGGCTTSSTASEPAVDRVSAQAQQAYEAEDWPQTLTLYQQLVQAEPANARYWYRLAVAQRYEGRLTQAMHSLEQGQKIGLPARFADYERAKVAATRGEGAQAVTYLQAAAEAGLSGANRVHDNPQLAALASVDGFSEVVDRLEANANPCGDEVYRQFDFWIGDWEVSNAAGVVAGRNRITSRDSSCLLLEEWTSASGTTGTSMNYYDTELKLWTQVWVSPGLQLRITGGLQDGSMVLTGNAHFPQQGTTSPFRGTWTRLEDGRVRQFFEQADDQGQWQPWFEGFYRRIE